VKCANLFITNYIIASSNIFIKGTYRLFSCNEDSKTMWQMGISVMPDYNGRGIGTAMVTILKNKILDMGILPYYGTAMSHIISQNTAVKAGFIPAWVELCTMSADQL